MNFKELSLAHISKKIENFMVMGRWLPVSTASTQRVVALSGSCPTVAK